MSKRIKRFGEPNRHFYNKHRNIYQYRRQSTVATRWRNCMDPIGLGFMIIIGLLVLASVVIPQIERRRSEQASETE